MRIPSALHGPGAAALVAAAAGAGCLMTPDPDRHTAVSPDGYADPAALAQAWATSLEARNFPAYAKLLASDFRFTGPDADIEDHPWLDNHEWSLADELAMVQRLLSPDTILPGFGAVRRVGMSLHVLAQRATQDGTEVDLAATILVSWGDDGALADTRMQMLVVPGEDGYLRIARMTEYGSPTRGIEPMSWTRIKLLFLEEV